MTQPRSIDVHAHCVPSALLDRIESLGLTSGPIKPTLTDLPLRLESMDATGIDVQVLSPWIDLTAYGLPGDVGAGFARLYNEELAAVAADHPDRFRAVCTVPLQSPEAAAAELRHAVAELGMAGVEIATTVAGRDLDDPDLEPFWTAAEELTCLILLHPCASLAGRGVSRYFLGNLVGNPAESTVAVAHLIFGGVLERHPDLKICVVHGGGFVPYQLGRWDHGYRVDARGAAANLTRLPSEWAARLYYDSVLHSPRALGVLVDTFGASQVVLGSDYPFEMGDSHAVQTVTDVPGLSETDRDRILSGNLSDLFDGVRR